LSNEKISFKAVDQIITTSFPRENKSLAAQEVALLHVCKTDDQTGRYALK
jgi:hypothetical protein